MADTGNHRVQVFTATGEFRGKWGSRGSGDGQFTGPSGLAVDDTGHVYVTDRENHRVQKFTAIGDFLRKWGFRGTGDRQFQNPHAITVDRFDSLVKSLCRSN